MLDSSHSIFYKLNFDLPMGCCSEDNEPNKSCDLLSCPQLTFCSLLINFFHWR